MSYPVLPSPDRCSGCAACAATCPRRAIVMRSDEEGFLQPHIEESKCVGCHLCEKACPVNHPLEPRLKDVEVYAARAKDMALRLASSSGGIFSLLARRILAQGGIVFGATCDLKTGVVHHVAAHNEDELAALRGSKYVQSDVRATYREAKTALESNIPVLFSGTPCQIAALRAFLNSPTPTSHANLFLVDVVCHAAPSPLAWQKFLEKRETASAQGRGSARAEGPIFRRISFRRKNCGWKRYSLSLRFANDKEYRADLRADTFLRGFLSELYNRRSCHQCAAREGRSGADVTLADYWRVHETFPQLDDDKGTSLVLVHTEKGRVLWQSLAGQVEAVASTLTDAVRTNPSIVRSAPPSPKRAKFFKSLAKGKDFDWIVERLLHRPLWRRCASFAKRVLGKALGK